MKIDVNVPNGTSGDWTIESFVVPENDWTQSISQMKTGRSVPAGTYKRLMRKGTCVMSNTPDEIDDFLPFVEGAKGHVLINGLGMGVVVTALLANGSVDAITIIEKSIDVIQLVLPHIKDERVHIIHADCFAYQPPRGERYGAVWHDIWDNICADNLPEMRTLHTKYARRTKFQRSWCRKECQQQNRQGY